jgi:hypothetical protein
LDFSIQYTTHPPTISVGSTVSGVSSVGPCGLNASLRDDYIKSNFTEIEKQIALGTGGHIDSLAAMSDCAEESRRLGELLQQDFVLNGNNNNLAGRMNHHFTSDKTLRSKCKILSTVLSGLDRHSWWDNLSQKRCADFSVSY